MLELLARSPADFVLVNIEDLWLEDNWQNVPGTETEHPNWRRRLRLTLDEMRTDEGLGAKLRWMDALRRGREMKRPNSIAGSSSEKRSRGREAAIKC